MDTSPKAQYDKQKIFCGVLVVEFGFKFILGFGESNFLSF